MRSCDCGSVEDPDETGGGLVANAVEDEPEEGVEKGEWASEFERRVVGDVGAVVFGTFGAALLLAR